MMPRFLWDHLKETKKPIVIYGMGDGCDKILAVCRDKGIAVSGIFASDEYVRGQEVHGFSVLRYREARERFGDMIVLLAFGVFRDDLMEKIKLLDGETEFYAPEVPLFGGELFDRAYYEKHKAEIRFARSLLADDRSKEIYDLLLEYKITGKIAPLLACESRRSEDLKSLLSPKVGGLYLDLGAYDGDTAAEWHEIFPEHGTILAVEPCAKTYRKLVENAKDIPCFQAVEGAVWYREESLPFNSKTGRAAAVAAQGKAQVKGLRADRITTEADTVKYDVEGVEREALLGSSGLIRDCRPELVVSAYHRTEDFFQLPMLVHAMHRGYRIHLRHAPYVPAWDTLYFFTRK